MSDVSSRLSERDIADLCALADGTLSEDRRAEVEARVAADPRLQELVDRQRRAVTATQALAEEPVPESLKAVVQEHRRKRRQSRARASWLAPRLGVAGAVTAAVAIVAVALSGGPAAPSVADAAQLATRQPSEPAPSNAGGAKLAANVEGVVFPDFRRAYRWRAVGARHGKLDGREVTVVYYAKGRRHVAYAIVSDGGLPRPSDARSTVLGGVRYQTLRLEGRPGVTWRRDGHTCVLVGSAPRDELLRLASY